MPASNVVANAAFSVMLAQQWLFMLQTKGMQKRWRKHHTEITRITLLMEEVEERLENLECTLDEEDMFNE